MKQSVCLLAWKFLIGYNWELHLNGQRNVHLKARLHNKLVHLFFNRCYGVALYNKKVSLLM